jgi:hypothetical protein
MQRAAPDPAARPMPAGGDQWPIRIPLRNGAFSIECFASKAGEPFGGGAFTGTIDTGATACWVSRDVARQIGVDVGGFLRPLPVHGHVILGGGQRVPCSHFDLDWKVGRLVVKGVRTLILHKEANGGNSVVGMTYLSRVRWMSDGDAFCMGPKA